jgi:ubiquinone/menaquinone biosynthesis C-methylase UbiE
MVEEFDVTDHHYDAVFQHIRKNFSEKCSNTIVPKSRYQSFQSLGLPGPKGGNSDSNTFKKYDASHLEEVLHVNDRFIDIGCNAGYFCIRAADKTDGTIVGVDMAQSWLELGSQINNSIFLHNNIIYIKAEALEFLSENPNSFDVIHCASTYHYFRDRQIAFLREAKSALTYNGLLVLEVELSDSENKPEVIKRSRGVDSMPCAFPNRSMFLQQITGLFRIESEFESVFQSGSFYKRVYFHLRPVPQKARFSLDKAQGNRVAGWAMYSKSPQQEITLLIKINNKKEFITVANRHRPDLLSKGIHPTGNCGFALTLPTTDTLSAGDTVDVYAGKVAGDKIVRLLPLISTKAL